MRLFSGREGKKGMREGGGIKGEKEEKEKEKERERERERESA